jgi:nucleotide-binding universal stress UspA family protein
MTDKVDQFESTFRAAVKEVYTYRPPELRKVLVVTDLDREAAATFGDGCRKFLDVLSEARWETVSGESFHNVAELLDLVVKDAPDLICTYRHLHSNAWKWPHSLGEHVDVLTQVTSCPVMVVPHPARGGALEHAQKDTDVVMAVTDHLTGDDRLVSFAARFTTPGGKLYLTHVEDESVFARYMEAIAKIPQLDTETARETIRAQLLKEPSDYIESCAEVLARAGKELSLTVEPVVTMGHRLSEYERLIQAHEVDLLVMNTKDEDQFAMHGLAYPLAVDLRSIPLLML